MKEDLGVDFDYDAIVISNGAKACLYATFFTLLDTGDEVIVPAPYWVSYTEQIRMVGGVPVIVPTTEAQHFKMTPGTALKPPLRIKQRRSCSTTRPTRPA